MGWSAAKTNKSDYIDAEAIAEFSQLISGTGSTGHCIVSVRDSNAAQPRADDYL